MSVIVKRDTDNHVSTRVKQGMREELLVEVININLTNSPMASSTPSIIIVTPAAVTLLESNQLNIVTSRLGNAASRTGDFFFTPLK